MRLVCAGTGTILIPVSKELLEDNALLKREMETTLALARTGQSIEGIKAQMFQPEHQHTLLGVLARRQSLAGRVWGEDSKKYVDSDGFVIRAGHSATAVLSEP